MTDSTLLSIESCPNVFVDACVRNTSGMLMFMSVYGRDTAIKELMARIQLGGESKDGLPTLVMYTDGETHKAVVGDTKGLQKLTGRLPRCVYGMLTHLWVYRPQVKGVSKSTGTAWVLVKQPEPDVRTQARVWSAVMELASIPLLPHWQTTVMEAISDMVIDYNDCNGPHINPLICKPIGFHRVLEVHLNQATLATVVSSLVSSGALTLDANLAIA
jgi:hypothetical protein